MNRYFLSFGISLIVYSSLLASVLYFIFQEDEPSTLEEVQEVRTVAVSLIQQQCHVKKDKIEKKSEEKEVVKKEKKVQPKPKPQPTIVEKEVVKKELEPEIEEIAMQETPEEPEMVDEEIKELQELKKESAEEVVDEQKLQEEIQQMMAAKKRELDLFTQYLIKKINDNKRYPMSARRRGIEGDVSVKFIVMANGGVDAIEVLEGKSIFTKSTIEAIEDSFPVTIANSLLQFPQEFKIKLVYILK